MNVHKNNLRIKWLIYSILGLILIGMSLSMVADAAIARYSGATMASWVLYGTFALIVFNSGLCLFIQWGNKYEKT